MMTSDDKLTLVILALVAAALWITFWTLAGRSYPLLAVMNVVIVPFVLPFVIFLLRN